MPKISVIMPTYNNGAYLAAAIDSVLAQTCRDFELIIINDSSTDASDRIITSYMQADSRIVYLKNEKNKGLINCLNAGLEKAAGVYIARLDGDDWWIDTEKLAKQVACMEQDTSLGLIGAFAQVVDPAGKNLFTLRFPETDTAIRGQILRKNCFVHSSVVFRKSIAQASGLYSPLEKYVEDYGLWLRIGRTMKFRNVPELMVGYRLQVGGESLKNNAEQVKASLDLVVKNKNYYPNYFLGYIKWKIKYYLICFFGTGLFGRLKLLIKS